MEYWMFGLFNMIFAFAAMVIDNILGTAVEGVGYGMVCVVLLAVRSRLAVTVRRLHDVGKSGWMYLSFSSQ